MKSRVAPPGSHSVPHFLVQPPPRRVQPMSLSIQSVVSLSEAGFQRRLKLTASAHAPFARSCQMHYNRGRLPGTRVKSSIATGPSDWPISKLPSGCHWYSQAFLRRCRVELFSGECPRERDNQDGQHL